MTIAPRDYRQPGRVLKQDLSTLLAASPEAFDCLVWIAKDSSHDEQVTVEQDVVGSIESGERAQSYEEPIQALTRWPSASSRPPWQKTSSAHHSLCTSSCPFPAPTSIPLFSGLSSRIWIGADNWRHRNTGTHQGFLFRVRAGNKEAPLGSIDVCPDTLFRH